MEVFSQSLFKLTINMERQKFIRKRDLVISGALAVASLYVATDAMGHASIAAPDYSHLDFKPVIVNNGLNKDSTDIRDGLTVIFPSFSDVALPQSTPESIEKPKHLVKAFLPNWKLDKEISWYGPGFYGKRTACGLELTKDLLGVANKSLSCGTLVTFEWKGTQLTVPVVDRGPYVAGRVFDLTGGACVALDHCFTGPINYTIEK